MILEAYTGKTRTNVLAIVAFLILILEFFHRSLIWSVWHLFFALEAITCHLATYRFSCISAIVDWLCIQKLVCNSILFDQSSCMSLSTAVNFSTTVNPENKKVIFAEIHTSIDTLAFTFGNVWVQCLFTFFNQYWILLLFVLLSGKLGWL